MKKIVVCFLLFALFCTAGFAREEGWKRGGMPKEIVEKLQLTPTQSAQLEKQYKNERQEMAAKFKEIKKLHETLDAAFIQQPVNESKISATIQLIKETQMELADVHFRGLMHIRTILTPEQFNKMITMRRELRNKMDKKMKHDMRQEFNKHSGAGIV